MAEPEDAVLTLEHFSLRFAPGRNLVDDVSFSVAAGETLCILGESGSGKSVTLRSILQLHPPRKTRTSGLLEVDGTDLLQQWRSELLALRSQFPGFQFFTDLIGKRCFVNVSRKIVEATLVIFRILKGRFAAGRPSTFKPSHINSLANGH